ERTWRPLQAPDRAGTVSDIGCSGLPEERGIRIEVATNPAGQEQSLEVGEHADRRPFIQERVRQGLALTLLEGAEYGFPGDVLHDDRAVLAYLESVADDLSPIDQRKGQAVGDERT